MDFTWGTKIQK